ncbi:MAG: hypothetical protein RL757_383 [Bacteroidota bacterium]|jgi:hypothetical protein
MKNKKNILLGCLLAVSMLFGSSLRAQALEISPLSMGNPQFFIDQLWQGMVNNRTSAALEGSLEIKLEDRNKNLILTASSTSSLRWQVGINPLPLDLRAKMQINYANNPLGNVLQETGRLPFGDYVLCYTIRDKAKVLGANCQEQHIKPMAPPALVFPMDKGTVLENRPLLTWRPPLPMQIENIEYALQLAELGKGQSPQEALRTQPLLVNERGISSTLLAYPATAMPLDTHKTYAWQVQAYSGSYFLGATEAWSFTLEKTETKQPTVQMQGYCWVKETEDGTYCSPTDSLKFVYDNQTTQTVLHFSIVARGNETVFEGKQMDMKRGINPISLAMKDLGKIRFNEMYYLIIHAEDGRTLSLPFRRKKQKNQ